MAFIQITRSTKRNQLLSDGAIAYYKPFRTGSKNRGGKIVFRECSLLQKGDCLSVFYDEETGKIGIKKDPYGQFIIRKNQGDGGRMTIFSKSLLQIGDCRVEYSLQSRIGKYDLILTPINQVYADLEKTFNDALSGNIN